jgi:peroxiredoxin
MRLSELRGKVVVLNFWATWCPPCVEEMPALNRLHARIAPQGALVLGISLDEDAQAYQRFLVEHQITFPTWRAPSNDIPHTYGTYKYPETYIIAPGGKIARKVIGPQEWDNPVVVDFIHSLRR